MIPAIPKNSNTAPLVSPYYGDGFEIYYPESDGQPMAETDMHRDLILDTIESLKNYFADQPDVYVTGNIMVYYVEGNPTEVVSPDTMIVKGVPKKERNIYKIWEEATPSVVFEIASRSTWKNDRVDKRLLYESLGVAEYFVYNPQYPKRLPALLAFRMSAKNALEPVEVVKGRVFSQELNLELVDTGDTLRFFDPIVNELLPTNAEIRATNKVLSTKNEELSNVNEELSTENQELKARIAELQKMLEQQS